MVEATRNVLSLNLVGGGTDTVRQVIERSLQLLRLIGRELVLAAVSVDAVHLVVQPGTRLAEVPPSDVPPCNRQQDVV